MWKGYNSSPARYQRSNQTQAKFRTEVCIVARWNDSYDLYDMANLRRDYLSKYCQQSEPLSYEELDYLEHFLNCTKPGLVIPISNLPNLSADQLYKKNQNIYQNWCLSWPMQLRCEKLNEKYVDPCFLKNPTVSVGFDIMTAFFQSACQKRGESLAYLTLFRKALKTWWYNERDVMSCFNEMSLEYYKRDINMVLNCLKYQLRHRFCTLDSDGCVSLLKDIEEEVKASYTSSGYFYLINLNMSLISKETFPLATDLPRATDNCQHAKFAYIAFFSLLALVLLTLGLLVSAKARFLNLPCYQQPQTHQELVQEDRHDRLQM